MPLLLLLLQLQIRVDRVEELGNSSTSVEILSFPVGNSDSNTTATSDSYSEGCVVCRPFSFVRLHQHHDETNREQSAAVKWTTCCIAAILKLREAIHPPSCSGRSDRSSLWKCLLAGLTAA